MKLEVKDVRKSFGDKEILKGISFEVESGKALGLLGRNGAGKTTTIRILMDVFHSNSGEILLDGEKFDRSKVMIGYLPEERGLYPKRKVLEQMIYLARLRGVDKKKATENSLRWLKRLEVDEYAGKDLETLSKGNQQKVQLASTLVADPEIVILDEPFSGLDPVNSQILKDVVNELIEEGKIVIFSSHQMSYVEEFCRDIVIINHGEIILSGNLLDIKKEYGKSQLVVSPVDGDLDNLKTWINNNLSAYVEVTGNNRTDVIVKLKDGITRMEFFGALSDKAAASGIEIEHFETYKPSLNDIFVERVGEEEKEHEEAEEGDDNE
ncbi:MAG: ATP-binding cassette domain-containing protein [Lachnospiraceae bacterium]|jgi:ABC-2 type transport system ATP-binding protein|nr:ATP-binding cassette domain-containing protein [Lachnospiraceae bacterium]